MFQRAGLVVGFKMIGTENIIDKSARVRVILAKPLNMRSGNGIVLLKLRKNRLKEFFQFGFFFDFF